MDRIYITLAEQWDTISVYDNAAQKWNYTKRELEPLGYGSASNKSGNFNESKMQKQRDWAYRSHEMINGEVWTVKSDYDYTTQRYLPATKTIAKHQPLVLDNVPTSGFKVEKIATRWSTANKLFRISDPRGFELEITAQNLLELMNSCIIDKGEVQGKCKWDFGKNGIGKAKLIWVSN